MTTEQDKRLTDNRFGRWGWSMIVYTFILYFFWAGLTTDGLNLFPYSFAEVNGWDANTLLAYATPASLVGVLGGFAFGQFIMRFRPRITASVTLIIAGILYALFGLSPSPLVYAIVLALICFFCSGFGLCVPPTLMANWFPRKKGLALGWATMGAPVCTAIFVPILSMLLGSFGLTWAFAIIGICIVILGIVSLAWVKDYPEDVNVLPDNLPSDENTAAILNAEKSYKSPFTLGKLLKDKDIWLMSIGFGLLWMVTVGIVSQFIPRMESVGYDHNTALLILTVCALIACPGSYFWGWLDQRVGTKFASVTYAGFYIISLVLLIFGSSGVITWIAAIFVCLGIGGLLNLMPSMVISVYGRYDFTAANRLVTPLASIIRVFAFALMAALLTISQGDYTLPYSVFIGIDILGAILLLFVTNKNKGTTAIDSPE